VGSGRYVLLSIVFTVGCLDNRRGEPLYAHSGSPRARSEVALLTGPIRAVDGVELESRRSAFELLPGCHIVEIGGSVGHVDPSQGGWAANLPRLTYAFRMRPGGSYSIEFERQASLGVGPMGWGRVVARADDDAGRAVVPLVRARAEIDECLGWRGD
jgi:hypothetical protein